jgi:hypothetical protein
MNNKEGTHATKMVALRRSNGGELADMSKEKPGGKEDGRPLEFADHGPLTLKKARSTKIQTWRSVNVEKIKEYSLVVR